MVFLVNKYFLLITLILLQSCSGGRIGNFLESSFKNIEETKTKEELKNNLKNKIVIKSEKDIEKNKNLLEIKTKEEVKNNVKNKIVIKSEKDAEKNKNIEEINTKEELKNNLKNKIVIESEKDAEKNKNTENTKTKGKIKKNLKNNLLLRTEMISKKNKKIIEKNIASKNRKYKPKSYKIIFTLKDVDPRDPTENLRTILRNSDVNFEIEKIERFFFFLYKIIKRN